MKTFRPSYDHLTPEERVQLVFAAAARGDDEEAARLAESCPRVKATIGDPTYTELLEGMKVASMGAIIQWLDVSHRVIQSRLVIGYFNERWLFYKGLGKVPMEDDPGFTKDMKTFARQDRALLVGAEAVCKQLSARWKGIEAAIMRFCAERGLTTEQLFPMAQGLMCPIEEARVILDAKVRVDRQAEDAMYQVLCLAMPRQKTRGSR